MLGPRYMTTDVKDFYLNTPITQYEHIWTPIHIIPNASMDKYNLQCLVHICTIYAKVHNGNI